ncbi:MAG: zinc-ribbon domain-containing protein [Clostridiales bacterium]|nr:zinc-ribbon domain-containing protein [Clostridiales bacterium]
MFCTQCGTQLDDDSKFCYKCGKPTHLAEQKDQVAAKDDYDPFAPLTPTQNAYAPPQQYQQPPQQNNAPAASESNFGLIGFILAFFFPILGIVFSLIGMTQKKNVGLATAGFIISLLFIVLAIVAIVFA